MTPKPEPATAALLQAAMDAAPRAPANKLAYHGTTRRRWAERQPSPSTLYLATTVDEAATYAYEAAAAEQEDGHPPRPMVYEVTLSDLAGMELGPDWGWLDATDATPWWESANEVSGFTAHGDVEALKARMRPSLDWRRRVRAFEAAVTRLCKPGSGDGRTENELRAAMRPRFAPEDGPR